MNSDLAKLVGVAPFDYSASTDGGGHEWQAWVRAFDWYLQANNITDDHVKFVKLMHLAGPKVQELFTTLSVPESVHKVNRGPLRTELVPHLTEYEMALAKLNEHFQPKKNLTYERHVFRQIKQEPDEKVAFFTMRLRKQADRCDFGDKFEEQVKDQIIEKCTSEKLRLKLLSLGDANLDRIMNEAKVFEAVQEQSEALNVKRNEQIKPEEINKIGMRPKPNQSSLNKDECHRCGYTGHHQFDEKCPAKGKTCNKCGGRNHFSRKCRSKKKLRPSKPYQAKSDSNAYNETKRDEPAEKETKIEDTETVKMVDTYQSNLKDDYIFCICESDGNKIKCKIGDVSVDVVIDSGSKYNIVDSKAWEYLKANKVVVLNQSKGSSHDFKAYGGYSLTMIGSFTAKIETAYKERIAEFCVLENYGKILIGYETGVPLGVMKIGENVNQVEKTEELSKMKGFVVDIPINKEVKPVAQPYRRMPVPLEEKVDKKIDELLSQGIIEKVNEPSPWISPMVPVPKGEDDVRICLDMKRANEAVMRENYPLPTMEDFLPHIGKGKVFAKLDVKDAFHQVEISEESRQITTFITRKGLYRYKRLMFGIACAPELYQKIMEQILAGCEGCLNYIDDIIIYAESMQQLNERVRKVLAVLKLYHVKLNKDKCIFGAEKLEFLGHHLSAAGITPKFDKVEAIRNFRRPASVEELRSFLGLVNFVGKFIPDLATITDPLRKLTKKNTEFEWGEDQERAFGKLKDCLSSELAVGFYDVKDRTQVYADASPVGLGAVLIQIHDKEPRVIAYANKSLSDTEKRYCQTEKEALALVWSVERFHFYLFGRWFDLITDHKPLEVIFSPKSKPCARIERWVLRMQSYKFKVIYRPGKNNIADPLSRLITTEKPQPCFDIGTEQYVNHIAASAAPIAIKLLEIEQMSLTDETIAAVKIGLANNKWEGKAMPLKLFETELCFAGPILLRGNRIVMPEKLRARTLELAHEGHPGMSKMKKRLRSKVWWPKMDTEVEAYVKKCHGCTMVSAPPAPEPLVRKTLPSEPWQHIAMDYLGPLPSGDYLLVAVDYFSRYKEVEIMRKIDSNKTIGRLRTIFARFGYPISITADNGSQLVSQEFRNFCNETNIHLNSTTPYWPQQNGEVERQNESMLKGLVISQNQKTDWKMDLQTYLHMYRSTPHATTLKTPSELMFGRTIRDKLPNIYHPLEQDEELRDRDKEMKEKGKQYADKKRHAKHNEIKEGDEVWLKRVVKTSKLTPTFDPIAHKVIERKGAELVVENMETKKLYRRNVSHALLAPDQLDDSEAAKRTKAEVTVDKGPRPKRSYVKPLRYSDYI